MSDKRTERVAHQIRDEISRYLQRGLLKDPRIGFVTISGVRVSRDLRYAKVFFSVFGEDQEAEDTLAALQRAQGFLRRKLGKDFRIRRVPELTFILDSSIETGVHIANVIQQLPEFQEEEDDTPDTVRLDWEPLIDTIKANQRFLVAAHRDPDGDAIGSTTALVGMLEQMGKEVVLLNDKEYPVHLTFVPFSDRMQLTLEGEAPFDVSILCDCGEVNRAPEGFPTDPAQRGTFLVIDHHLTSKLEGDLCYNDPTSPAVGVLMYDLAKQLDCTLTKDIASSIYCAIVSDTGSFRYEKTNPHTFRIAAECLEAGVEPWAISSGLFESNPIERQHLLASALQSLDLQVEGKVAFMTITKEMIEAAGAIPQMTDGFINFGRGVRGVEVAVLFREEDDQWKLSFRSRGLINVAEIASAIGGGGHHNAAGASFAGELSEIKQMVCDAATSVCLS
jgi:phosphoesterase RecJ-like protein